MYEVEGDDYQCPACSRKQPWRPESAGREVTCSCGAVLVVPFSPGQAEPHVRGSHPARPEIEEEAQTPENGEAAPPVEIVMCPDCGATMRPGAIVCIHCGYHQPRPKKRVFRRRKTDRAPQPVDDLEPLAFGPVRDLWLPIGLASAGLIAEIVMLAHAFKPPHSWADALGCAPLILLLSAAAVAVVYLIAVLLSPVLELSLGPVGPWTAKLVAAVIFPAAFGAAIWALCGQGISGMFAGWVCSLLLYLSLFRMLFEFDWPDSLLLIALVCLAHAVTLLVVLWPLTLAAVPLPELWWVFGPIVAQSALTFLVTGAMVLPHFREA
jgi:ribosomal protein L40E